MADSERQSERAFHSTVLIGDTLYTWGGNQHGLPGAHDNMKKRSYRANVLLYHIPSGTWDNVQTKGEPPSGMLGYSCCEIDSQIYYFGGYCGHDVCYYNELKVLDSVSFEWKDLPTSANVMKRAYGGMVAVEDGTTCCLLMIGGKGSPPVKQLPNAQYVSLSSNHVRTNEHNLFNVSSKKWATPNVVGECMPPTSYFTINSISKHKFVIFGGWINERITMTSNVYLVDFIDQNTFYWQCIKRPYNYSGKWPNERYLHSSYCINGVRPTLVTLGGCDEKKQTIEDDGVWILAINSSIWTKVTLPGYVTQRRGHSISVFMITPQYCWLVIIGGGGSYKGPSTQLLAYPNATVVIELILRDGQWNVGFVFDSTLLGSSTYQKKLIEMLKLGRREWSKSFVVVEKSSSSSHQNIESLTSQLELTNKTLLEKETLLQQKDIALREAQRQIQSLRQEKQNIQKQLREKERELQEKIHTRQVKQSHSDYWVVSKDDVTMTDEVLGSGAYGNVTVAVFRGLRVAAKCLHHLIISDYNLALFSREMDIASRIRHPNLVQFIGATKVGSPIILTELMCTSLYKELQKKSLSDSQILAIARDIALALNYLHLWKPDPIIHRDVSSPNVLLEPTVGDGYKAKVTDYGTANLQQHAYTYMPGNPAYAAPESRDPHLQSPSMDVYSYSVLLMEMTLHCPPCMTVRERDIQAQDIQWSPMRTLVQNCIKQDYKSRPTISQILNMLRLF